MNTQKKLNVEVYEYTQPVQYCHGPHTDNMSIICSNWMGGMSHRDWLIVARAKKQGGIAYDSVLDWEEYRSTVEANCSDTDDAESYVPTRVIVLAKPEYKE